MMSQVLSEINLAAEEGITFFNKASKFVLIFFFLQSLAL